MKTSAEILLKRIEILYANIYSLLEAFSKASTTNSGKVTCTLKNEDGTTKTVDVNSFQQLQNEISRIDNNFKSITTNNSFALDKDGSVTRYVKTTFMNANFIDSLSFGNVCKPTKTSILEDFVFPTVTIPIRIENDIVSNTVHCRIYDITSGFDKITDDETLKELKLKYLKENGTIDYTYYERSLNIDKYSVDYYGTFNVESVQKISGGYSVSLNTVTYTSRYTIGNVYNLNVGDTLVSKNGYNKFEITSVDIASKSVTLKQTGGIEPVEVGIASLQFNQTITDNSRTIAFPVKPAKKLIVFFSTESDTSIAYPSKGFIIDTENFTVEFENNTYTIDEYFQKYVTNFTEYLTAIVNESTIPYSLGIKPAKPVLTAGNFKVVQINKHMIDTNTQAELNELNKNKLSIQNDIDYKQNLLTQTQNEVDTFNFNSAAEKEYRLKRIVELRSEINALKQNLLTVTRDINSVADKYGLKSLSPKYRVIGFWDIQDNLYSPLTGNQEIIKYDVMYRYLSKNADTTSSVTYKMISNGKEVTVSLSNWNEFNTKTLTRINGRDWESPRLDSTEDISINQCSISINENESVEIKIRAVTEAGYPISPMKSEWSEILRIDFPTELKQTNLQSSISQNSNDLNKAEFEDILIKAGLSSHIAGTIKESEKTFHHSASDIASGQYTAEQKNIPLDVVLSTIMNKLKVLEGNSIADNIVVSFVDFDGSTHQIQNNTTIEVSAGYYQQLAKEPGEIIRKRGYIKIRNNNTTPIELRSLVPGSELTELNAVSYVNVPVKIGPFSTQQPKQILYFRNMDLIGQINGTGNTFKLVVPETEATRDSLIAPDSTHDLTLSDDKKNLIGFNGTNVSVYGLKTILDNYLSFTTEHPMYNKTKENFGMLDEFERIKKFHTLLSVNQYQVPTKEFGFVDNDKYLVGRTSCGAYLYPLVTNQATITVNGESTTSSLIISKESEVLIPIIFEYRMKDRLGNVGGIATENIQDLEYSKKLGVDMIINNSLFKFDINVISKLRNITTTINTNDLTSVIGSYKGESKENLI